MKEAYSLKNLVNASSGLDRDPGVAVDSGNGVLVSGYFDNGTDPDLFAVRYHSEAVQYDGVGDPRLHSATPILESLAPDSPMPAPTLPPLPDNILDLMNASRGGFGEGLGLRFVHISYMEVRAEIPVGPHLHQPYGLVHGGVYSSIIETLASTGAAMNAGATGMTTVGLENSTSFLRAVRDGTLHAKAFPLARGRRTQVWEATVTDDDGEVAATGRVRMICLEPGASVAREKVAIKTRT